MTAAVGFARAAGLNARWWIARTEQGNKPKIEGIDIWLEDWSGDPDKNPVLIQSYGINGRIYLNEN